MTSIELERVKIAYKAMKKGTGTEEAYKEAVSKMNGSINEDEIQYFVIATAGYRGLANDFNNIVVVFNTEISAVAYAHVKNVGDSLLPVSKSMLLKQFDPEKFIRLNPDPTENQFAIAYIKLKDLPNQAKESCLS